MPLTLSDFSNAAPAAHVGILVRHRREALGLTQAELATRLSLDLGLKDIAALEAGRITLPCWSFLLLLGRALALPAHAILVGSLVPAGGATSGAEDSVA